VLNDRPGPAIVIAASGMCEAGRILHHLKHHLAEPSTTVLFVGYQAEHTLGRRILEGQSPVPVLGSEIEVRARIERADAYSAHADREGLIAWAEGVREQGRVRKVFLVHGEEHSALALADALRGRNVEVDVPSRGDAARLD
jgi:metallo-beta-lactamase family protein